MIHPDRLERIRRRADIAPPDTDRPVLLAELDRLTTVINAVENLAAADTPIPAAALRAALTKES